MSASVLLDFFRQYEKEKEEAQKATTEIETVKIKDSIVQEKVKKEEMDKKRNENIDKKIIVAAKIVERMVNLNTYDEIAKDFRFYEDPADEFKDNEGSLLPLWSFKYKELNDDGEIEDVLKGLEVTGLKWSPRYVDLFAVTYGSYDFYTKAKTGYLCFFSLKNCSYPEYICSTWCGILCMDIHPAYPHIIVVGLYDGNIAIFNLQSNKDFWSNS